jgi:integrase
MLSACEGERLGALFVTMLGTGMRPGEAAGLRWSAVDLKAKTLAIRSARRRSAKGAIEIVEGLKTRQSRRTLGLPGFVVDALTAHRSAQRAERLAAPRWADPDLAFTTTVGSAVAQPSMRMALAAIAEKAGLGPLSPNELRHSAASVMVDAGEPLDHVAQRLGHRDTRMLEQTYRHAVRPSIDHGVAAMERLVTG